ncbi:MAG: transcription termination/antitermination protein NusA [Deltaproteobacteria bacterium]|nr:transcription termination/antitermination protein NusA [Deltaproteobacteria bacterium]MBW2594430.1 transcription termination/antitermination protein NusA [Deltaproteobacteria bacterium]
MLPDLKRLIEQMGKEKGIDKEIIIDALETAVLTAARKKLGADLDLEVTYNEEAGEMETFLFKTVVEHVLNADSQISLEETHETMDEDAELGDSLGIRIETDTFGRIAVQTAKQIIIQKVKDAERDNVYEEYKDRKGDLVNGFVQRFEGGSIIVSLGMSEGVILPSEQIKRESFRRGERIRAYIYDVKRISKGPQILLSRTHPGFIRTLFEMEVPEISEGLIDIVNIAREPGNRTKISVKSVDKDIDPVGACVGMRGSRVQGVVQELRGEKIDIVPCSDDPVRYVCNALSPAKVDRVYMDEDARTMEVIVPDDQLSLAIGRAGQNVRLAARLTGWRIDVKNETGVAEEEKEGYTSLMRIAGIGERTANLLYEEGYKGIAMVASAEPEALSSIKGISQKKAIGWIEEAKKIIDNESSENLPEDI